MSRCECLAGLSSRQGTPPWAGSIHLWSADLVKGGLHAGLVTTHFATAMILMGTLVYVTASAFATPTGAAADGPVARSGPGFARLTVLTTVATFALLLVGAYVRGQNAGQAFPDWP